MVFVKIKEKEGCGLTTTFLVLFNLKLLNLEVTDLVGSRGDEAHDLVLECEQNCCNNHNDRDPDNDFNVGRTILTTENII